jgi:EmrB/QacA subfamily drug resistance transporter
MALKMITEKNRKWWILAAMTTTISMIFVDITVLPVVLPTLQRELSISDLGLQWVINAYTLVLAVLVLAGGKLGDMWGLKKAFCLGVSIFALASAMCGLSYSEWWLIMSRGLQGIGGAFLLPATQGIIISHFPPHQRGKALGLFVSIGSIFLALGPLIGGALTSYFSWHYVFWINIPIAILGLVMASVSVPAMVGKKATFDHRGFLILAIGITSLIFALMQVQKWGWNSSRCVGLFIIGIFSLVFLFKRKHKPHASILDFALMKKRTFIASSSSIFCNQLLIMVTVFWAIYFQNILEFSPSKAGLYAFMANLPVLFAAPLGGFLVDRFGPRLPVMIGFGVICFSLSWFTLFMRHENIWLLLPTLLFFGCGVSMIFTPSYVGMMNEVSAEKRGVASGITSTLRQFGSTLGLALFGTFYSSIYFGKLGHSLHEKASTTSLTPEQFEGLLSKSPEAMQNMDRLSSSDALYVFQSAKNAFLSAFLSINLCAAMVALVGIVIAWKLLKNRPIHVE